MREYMQAMAQILDGADAGELRGAGLKYINPKFASVYRNNSVSAFVDVLKANYKTVLALVGEDYFSALALAHLEKYPAYQRTLVGYGRNFSGIVEGHVKAHNLAYLSSFAKLDRAWTLAHMAADRPPVSMGVLQDYAASGGDLESYKLALKPDVNLVRNKWPVFALWARLRDDTGLKSALELKAKTEHVLVWRRDLDVMYKVLNPGEFAFLTAIQNGATLGLATAQCLSISPETDMGSLLGGMMAAGIFTTDNGDTDA